MLGCCFKYERSFPWLKNVKENVIMQHMDQSTLGDVQSNGSTQIVQELKNAVAKMMANCSSTYRKRIICTSFKTI